MKVPYYYKIIIGKTKFGVYGNSLYSSIFSKYETAINSKVYSKTKQVKFC